MAIVYGEIDCLNKLINLLNMVGVHHVTSLEELLEYKDVCDENVRSAELRAREELRVNTLSQLKKISDLISEDKVNQENRKFWNRIYRSIVFRFKLFKLKRDLNRITNNADRFIEERTKELSGIAFTSKQVLDANYNLIHGARGEQQAINELRKLPDQYYVVNDVKLSFLEPLYEPKTGQRIYSIQADHIVVAPSGVFLIETKNWSKETLKRTLNYTAFEQIHRTNFALYCYLNPRKNNLLSFFVKRKKIPVRNILLMVGEMTDSNERFVKVVSISQLINYIMYFPAILSEEEKQAVLNELVA